MEVGAAVQRYRPPPLRAVLRGGGLVAVERLAAQGPERGTVKVRGVPRAIRLERRARREARARAQPQPGGEEGRLLLRGARPPLDEGGRVVEGAHEGPGAALRPRAGAGGGQAEEEAG
eukprot:CAMPEP_0171227578 /NCGR_PEP_ID=MMETSP0790-20130122/37919_1 /TAXON_ID=2925 /ORGANISM="Alexandrium catenella, Strain OF101" /LENGTH=117 /DNA_ID=CAMNT_0011693695 /DNA_START=624 /DNA_END=973 /DNA_ORIENTATION=-